RRARPERAGAGGAALVSTRRRRLARGARPRRSARSRDGPRVASARRFVCVRRRPGALLRGGRLVTHGSVAFGRPRSTAGEQRCTEGRGQNDVESGSRTRHGLPNRTPFYPKTPPNGQGMRIVGPSGVTRRP